MGELMQQYIDEAEQDLLHTYNRYQVVLDRGDGVSLYDIEGKRYLDFVAGIAVFALGYHNAEYNDALKAQIDKVIHTSNYYYNVPAVEAARHLKKVSRMDRVFFTNSGAEADVYKRQVFINSHCSKSCKIYNQQINCQNQ